MLKLYLKLFKKIIFIHVDIYRFYCDNDQVQENSSDVDIPKKTHDSDENLYLSVLNIKFQGDVQQSKRTKTCFKYKSVNNRHRMFIKQIVEDEDDALEESRLSINPNYYFDEYVKYIINGIGESRPSTGKSSINNSFKTKDIKAVQAESVAEKPKPMKNDSKINNNINNEIQQSETKISYHKTGKRKSLTISRIQSPETIQVIRVDVTCNNNSTTSSVISVNDENIKQQEINLDNKVHKNKINSYTNKYLLTNSIKSLDQKVSGGSKVTLLCKTFKLSERSKENIYNKSQTCKKYI